MTVQPLSIWVVSLCENGEDAVSLSDQYFFVSEQSARACETELAEHFGDGITIVVEKQEVEV